MKVDLLLIVRDLKTTRAKLKALGVDSFEEDFTRIQRGIIGIVSNQFIAEMVDEIGGI